MKERGERTAERAGGGPGGVCPKAESKRISRRGGVYTRRDEEEAAL